MTAIRIPFRAARIAPPQFDMLNARAADLRRQGRDVISLGQALPPFGPPEVALEAVRRAIDRPDTHVYSADAGRPALRRALCDRLRSSEGVHVDPDEVVITAGANQAFMLALMTMVDPGDEVLLPGPYFVNHQMAIAAYGAVPVEAPLLEADGFALRWRDLEPRVTSRTRAVVVCTPSNPTGAVIGREELAGITRELAARGVLLIADETYARFVYDGGFASLAATERWRDNGIVVSTFSKMFGVAGWRVGYLLAPRHVCEAAVRIQDAMIICAPVPAQAGVEAAVRDAWNYADAFRLTLRARRDRLSHALNGIPRLHWRPAAGAFFAFVRVDGCSDSAALAADILDRGAVVTIPGSTFGLSGEGFLRLSYSAVSDEALDVALDRLRAFFERAV